MIRNDNQLTTDSFRQWVCASTFMYTGLVIDLSLPF